MPLSTFWLSFHASYACRQSGVCCSSGWDIAIEASRVDAVAREIGEGRIDAPVRWLRSVDEAPDGVAGLLAQKDDGRCVFHQAPGCAVQSALGHQALPSACQHFPRVVLVDPRGVFVTLSHYCPTAASLLFDASGPATIVEGPAALPGGAPPEGLDARDALPPSRSPRLLMDWESYSAWERRGVELLTTVDRVEEALDTFENEVLTADPAGRAARPRDPAAAAALFAIARGAVPAPYSWPVFVPPVEVLDGAVVGRYLAAHLFGSWMAYQGNGLLSTVTYLRLVLAVLRVEAARGVPLLDAIRQSDLLLRHLADPHALAEGVTAIAAR